MEVSSKTLNEIDEAKEKENLRLLEAVFFVSGRLLSMSDLISLTDLNPIILRELIEKLQDRYNNNESSLEIIEKSGSWKMDVRAEYHNIINKLATGSAEFTKAEQETLAIIAYKQPIKQSVIIRIRGNKAYEHIKKFCDLSLLRKKRMGHTHELSLRDDFYDYFNVSEPSPGGNPLKVSQSDDGEVINVEVNESGVVELEIKEETDEDAAEETTEENGEEVNEETGEENGEENGEEVNEDMGEEVKEENDSVRED